NHACHKVRRACAQRGFPFGIRMKKEKGPDDEQTPMKRSPSKGVNDVGTRKRGSNVVIISVPGRK
ncbi:hypothetical protein ALY17_00005, partial [Salmonella enterica subsp. enterica]|nr:hypothetical protein [Salmonella enterica subsp. enterica]